VEIAASWCMFSSTSGTIVLQHTYRNGCHTAIPAL
jgi:hypothetical protein